MTIDRITTPLVDVEVKAIEGGNQLVGYAARFLSFNDPQITQVQGFRERIMPGAFRKALTSGRDFLALYNHESGDIIGRISNNTLKLYEDSYGLRFELNMIDEPLANRVKILVEKEMVKGCSFGFWTPTSTESIFEDSEGVVLEYRELDMFEISLTPFPVYPATSVRIRAVQDEINRQRAIRHELEYLDLLKLTNS